MDKLRKFIRQTLSEFVTPQDIKSVDDYADDLFSDVGVDVKFSDHFMQRVNDYRNKQDITPLELKWLYDKAHDRYADMISKLPSGSEKVFADKDTQINIPFVVAKNNKTHKKDLINKTIMRKKDFASSVEKLFLEDISRDEATNVINSIKTIIDGKRNVGWISWVDDNTSELLKNYNINSIKVPSNHYGAYIIYKPGAEAQAKELNDIAEKYNGFLSHKATKEDTIRIGQLLGYKQSDIDAYVQKNYGQDENIDVPINVGDEVLGGKFKNKKIVVKDIGKNEKGDITINDKPLLRVRTKK